ncbi:MAG: hypothetical protein A2289_22705 [Deltaproteobacteria bacterium RIFOXYA12_FULL_58_15]|nr:MAG: hypothetical protein A2289_22705 [Deltaproteobacteria bacterium RIFOXYA12_FULL_58_15]OGR12773.1 MAG: hypothetical protein A2341_21810 [Deltaproteobacteria bacterium RIFOXYB12_FULL_58_9]
MTFEEARLLVREYLDTLGLDSPGLNSSGMGGAVVGDLEVYFEYAPKHTSCSWIGLQTAKDVDDAGSWLRAHARIYTFMREAKPEVLAELQKAAQNPNIPNAGGEITYMSENHGLFLSRSYDEAPAVKTFCRDIEVLMATSRHWLENVVEECLERARGRAVTKA